jgi:hypothetical protein
MDQMGKTQLFAASVVVLIVACIAGAVSATQARGAAPQIDPFQVMTNAKQMPA